MLETIALPGSGRVTTRLGFGGSGLMGGISERESLRLLETAYDAGIRHFDVAPAYGHGQAERCLGKFLRGKREQVTVATKYGILPPGQSRLLDSARSLIRPVVARMPAVRKRVAQAAAGMRAKARFSAEEAAKSLENSRRELGLDAIDVWLLHEVTAEDLDASDLLPFLEEMQGQGRIGAYGVGAEDERVRGVWESHREYCQVVQFEWSPMEGDEAEFPGAFAIHHRAMAGALGPLRRWLQENPEHLRGWSNALDLDLSDSKLLAGAILQAALAANPQGIVLFSSRMPEHIRENVKFAEEASAPAQGKRLLELIPQMRDLNPHR